MSINRLYVLSVKCVGRHRCLSDFAPNANCDFILIAEEQEMCVTVGLKKVIMKTVICLTMIPVMKMRVDPFHNVEDVVDTLTSEPVPNVEVMWCIAHRSI